MGKYSRSLKVLQNAPAEIINDEYLMLEGLLHEELGNKECQIKALYTLIQLFPQSDYFTIAKLQYKMLSR